MNTPARISWIDNLRAIGILLVMTGHGHANWRVILWLYTFHAPLFFFLSGYLLSDPARTSPLRWIRHRLPALGLPYVFLGAMNLLYLHGTGWFHSHSSTTLMNAFGLHLAGIRDSSPVHGALWFLASLGAGELLFLLLKRHFPFRVRFALLLALSVAGGLLLRHRIHVPYSLDISLFCLPFLELGSLYRKYQERIDLRLGDPKIFGVLLVASVCGGLLLPRVDLYYGKLGNPFLLHAVAACGIFSMLRLAQAIPTLRLFDHLGRHSIAYLGLHLNIVFGLIAPLTAILHSLAPSSIKVPLLWFLEIAACVALIGPFSLAVSRWAPVLLGGRKHRETVK